MNKEQKLVEFEYEFFYKLKENNPNIIILSVYKGMNNYINFKCSKCGYVGKVKARDLKNGRTKCGVCSGRKTVKGVNTIEITHPQNLIYFVDIEDAKSHTYGSNEKVDMKCPICNTIRNYSIIKLNSRGFVCTKCTDNRSYPEKFMYNLLDQLKLKFKSEVIFKWSGKYRYDFVFNEFIVEMDGLFHKVDNNMNGTTAEQSKQTDDIKDAIAIENGYEIIRIEAYESNFLYLKNKVLNSNLKNILNLKYVDWQKLELDIINKSLLLEVSELWKKGTRHFEIADILHINKQKVTSLLKTSARVGMTNYDPIINKFVYKPISSNSVAVKCLNDNKIFYSMKQAELYYGIYKNGVGSVCHGERLSVHNLEFDFVETTPEIQAKKDDMRKNNCKGHASKSVQCIETQEIFKSASECDRQMGFSIGLTSGYISGFRNNKDGFHFKFVSKGDK